MGHYEDTFYEVYETINKYGLQKEYNKQIKMLSDIGYQVETAEELLKFDE